MAEEHHLLFNTACKAIPYCPLDKLDELNVVVEDDVEELEPAWAQRLDTRISAILHRDMLGHQRVRTMRPQLPCSQIQDAVLAVQYPVILVEPLRLGLENGITLGETYRGGDHFGTLAGHCPLVQALGFVDIGLNGCRRKD